MGLIGDARVIGMAQLRAEFRHGAGLVGAVTTGGLGLVLVAFVAGPDITRLRDIGPGLIWLGLLYAVVVSAERVDATLRANDVHSALWLQVEDRRSLFLANVFSLGTLLVTMSLALVSLAMVLLDLGLRLADLPIVAVTAVLAGVAAAAVGSIIATVVGSSADRSLLAPVAMLPLLAPVLLGGTGVIRGLIDGESDVAKWLLVLTAHASLSVGIGLLVFEAAVAPE